MRSNIANKKCGETQANKGQTHSLIEYDQASPEVRAI